MANEADWMAGLNYVVAFSAGVAERQTWPLDGGDTVIASVPQMPIERLRLEAVHLGELCAKDLGTLLHHGNFILTTHIPTVRTFGLMGEHRNCAECLDGLETAVARLTQKPDHPMLIGQLYWSPRPNAISRTP